MGVKYAVLAFVTRVCVASLVVAGLAASEGCRGASPHVMPAGIVAVP